MPQISFNPQALGTTGRDDGTNMRHAIASSTPEPIVIPGIDVKTILEGLCLADIEGLKLSGNEPPTGDIDT